jgi:hypothetical protein
MTNTTTQHFMTIEKIHARRLELRDMNTRVKRLQEMLASLETLAKLALPLPVAMQ